MARHETPTLALGLVACCAGVVVLLQALVLGSYIEGTSRAVADAAKGQQMAVPAVVALVAGVVALAGRRHRWALAIGCVGAVAAVVAVLLTVLLPGGRPLTAPPRCGLTTSACADQWAASSPKWGDITKAPTPG